jgi:hypothetical protein
MWEGRLKGRVAGLATMPEDKRSMNKRCV